MYINSITRSSLSSAVVCSVTKTKSNVTTENVRRFFFSNRTSAHLFEKRTRKVTVSSQDAALTCAVLDQRNPPEEMCAAEIYPYKTSF